MTEPKQLTHLTVRAWLFLIKATDKKYFGNMPFNRTACADTYAHNGVIVTMHNVNQIFPTCPICAVMIDEIRSLQ
jgi:hypothetical protein